MNGRDNSLFYNKFAQRILLLFVSTVIVPVAIIALLSFEHVSKQLREQSYEQSRQASKIIGMELFRRLALVKTQMDEIGKTILAHPDFSGHFPSLDETLYARLNAIAFVLKTGKTYFLRGEISRQPTLSAKQKQQLARGKTVIIMQENPESASGILLIQLLDRNDPSRGQLIAEISPEFLWSIENLRPSATELVVLDPSAGVLYSSQPLHSALIGTLTPLLAKTISGHYEWNTEESTYLASYWSVFTDADFSAPSLVIVVSQPESDVLAPIRSFKSIYIPLILLAIFVMLLIAVSRIRKKLAPLVTLRDATQRIAGGDFGTQVRISSDDELGQLGEAFNTMANKLDAQFTSLSTMAEIDRLILSSFDTQYIIETVLNRAGDLTPCAVCAVLELDDEQTGGGRICMRVNMSEAEIVTKSVQLSKQEIDRLSDNPDSLLIASIEQCPSYCAPLLQDSSASNLLLFPAFVRRRLAAVIIIGYTNRHVFSKANWEQLRKFSDHVAVALSNARWEERLYHQAHYDTLTDLPNRALLKDRLEQAIARAQRNRCDIGVLFLDLDRFKLVNDSLGHAEGDRLLCKIADLLVNNVRNVDTIVRFGGDEFVVIIPDLNRVADTEFELGTIANKILAVCKGDFELGKHKVHAEMSIGIALYPRDGDTPDELIKNADTAMYHAKEHGRGRYMYFAPELNTAALHRLNMRQELHRALENDEFTLRYQPKVDCISGKLVGAEALISWHHPERGWVPPDEFIGFAEENGLIREIGEWVLRAACQQSKIWRDAGLPAIRLAVNVSPNQFQDDDFLVKVGEILRSNQIDPQMLELEVTEGTLMDDVDKAIEKLNQLNALGIYLSIDDFGTGYSSLSYLRRLPIHALKIDKSFVTDMVQEPDVQAIVSAAIFLAHQLKLNVVAEGVETVAQQELLRNLQCDELQGYLISKPVSPDRFERLLSRHHTSQAAG